MRLDPALSPNLKFQCIYLLEFYKKKVTNVLMFGCFGKKEKHDNHKGLLPFLKY